MTVSRFNVHVSENLVVSQTYFYIKKRDTLFIGLIGKLNTAIKFIKKMLNSSAPFKENIIYVSEPY